MQKLWRWRLMVSPSIVPSGNFAELNRIVTFQCVSKPFHPAEYKEDFDFPDFEEDGNEVKQPDFSRSVTRSGNPGSYSPERLATLTPLGLGSNTGEDVDVRKCIVPSWHGGTLNNCRAARPLVRSPGYLVNMCYLNINQHEEEVPRFTLYIQGVVEFVTGKLRRLIVDSLGTTNHHRTWGLKPRLVVVMKDEMSSEIKWVNKRQEIH
ncbi:hypothetical protein TNCV_1740811 [Trichonephila clavipes]|uniref:Uncharacterized protein n=1 Tax=Trichonephila clavipes TaxID=2585209 RepID=A0A8X6UTN5_TRICX|nr:hypothetical protein TNCV_1740811 [Trichonephila clavipes]